MLHLSLHQLHKLESLQSEFIVLFLSLNLLLEIVELLGDESSGIASLLFFFELLFDIGLRGQGLESFESFHGGQQLGL